MWLCCSLCSSPVSSYQRACPQRLVPTRRPFDQATNLRNARLRPRTATRTWRRVRQAAAAPAGRPTTSSPGRRAQSRLSPTERNKSPASAYVAAMSAVSLASMANAGLSELRGHHMAYSKFWHVVAAGGAGGGGDGNKQAGGALLRSRDGMLVAYAPALAAAAASFAVPGAVEGVRAQLLSAALAAHFLKRVLEVLFVHRYSGRMQLDTAATIGCSYLLSTATMIYAQHLSRGLPEPPVDLLCPGVLVLAVGLAGNFYHHYLLSRLRADGGGGDKGYKIPRGGLFELVTCPHYLFEILGFFGFAMIAQTAYALAVATGTAAYLAGRSCATRRWYESKFEEFPARIKALVPYLL